MATRFWLPSQGTPPVAPAFDPGWDVVTQSSGLGRYGFWSFFQSSAPPDRIQAITTRATSSYSKRSAVLNGPSTRTALRQYVSAPLGPQTITGTVKGVIRAFATAYSYFGTGYPVGGYISIRVVSNDGATVRGTLLALAASGTAEAFAATLKDHKFPNLWTGSGAALSSVAALDGDRIVIEIGVGPATGASGSYVP